LLRLASDFGGLKVYVVSFYYVTSHISAILGAFAILQKAIISLVMSVRLSFRVKLLDYHGMDFY
jgi:hypothetical protein